MTTTNSNLNLAKRTKNDEFYTGLEDVEAELAHYGNHFRDKAVYLNCDDMGSAFWQYFSERFDELGLRRLVATKYPEGLQFRQDRGEGLRVIQLEGDGDFRSDECVELLKQADIVVTNPPFSLFREYVAQLVEHGKQFVILGNMNALTYKEVFSLFQRNLVWYGPSIRSGDREFAVPDDYPLTAASSCVDEHGNKFIRVKGVRWFTNLDFEERHRDLILTKKYSPHEYPRYANFDAIEVSRTADIPKDYPGLMGVPITFIDKYNPDQFEIVGSSKTLGRPMSEIAAKGTYQQGGPRFYLPTGKSGYRRMYDRILIRRRRDATTTKPEGAVMKSGTKPTYLVWDVETTGIDALNDRIIQLVIATADEDGNVIEHWEWFINPDVPVPDEAAEVHGFTNAFLSEKGRFATVVFDEAIDVFREHYRLVQVAFNMNFDLTFLDAEFKRWGIADNFGAAMSEYARLYDCYVTDRACDKYRKGKRKLLNLADHYGIEYDPESLHNALADVTLTAKVAVAVRNKYGLPTNQQQADWHKAWAENFRDYLRRNGKTEEEVAGVSGDWPLRKE